MMYTPFLLPVWGGQRKQYITNRQKAQKYGLLCSLYLELCRFTSRAILELYRDLGGEILTVGSDSHRPEHLGAYIREGQELLKSLGFKRFCTFEGMKPVFHEM
ncbi:MAG: hypothetical protein J6J87_08190 [Oscillospiraceae bacterium]|nr:hypothetical protein [Oscillospiraceae bacterium]